MKIGYARVSTSDQNLDLQISALVKAECDEIFKEKVSSMKKRPEFERLIKYIRKGDILVIWKLDRLARDLRQLIFTVDDLERRGIQLISLSDNIDTTTPIGKFFFHLNGALGQFERSLISERTKAGLQAAMERGVKLGRKKGLSENALKKANIAAIAYKNKTISPGDICKQLHISTSTLYRYLRHENIPLHYNHGRKKRSQLPTPKEAGLERI